MLQRVSHETMRETYCMLLRLPSTIGDNSGYESLSARNCSNSFLSCCSRRAKSSLAQLVLHGNKPWSGTLPSSRRSAFSLQCTYVEVSGRKLLASRRRFSAGGAFYRHLIVPVVHISLTLHTAWLAFSHCSGCCAHGRALFHVVNFTCAARLHFQL